MKTVDFDYILPKELIAQRSVVPRDSSRLMVINREKKLCEHKIFSDVVDYFKKGDVLVWNNSKVFKARLLGKMHSRTGRDLVNHMRDVEIFLVRPMENVGVWKVLAKPGKHVLPGMTISFAEDFYCNVMLKEENGTVLVQFPYNAATVRRKANQHGHIPIPPYVKDEPEQFEFYQTVYAKEEGSVAAPTAGFHFTPRVIEALKKKGVDFAEVTLHVGLGTFLPVKSEDVEDHIMHGEWVEITEENAEKINTAKQEGRRIVAVGTTSVRTLEGVAQFGSGGRVNAYEGDINMFILPGFTFQIVDVLITNFHLPKSTLLMLVSAFAGDREFMLRCYEEAVSQRYRFFSFGDAMIIY
ncbi:MAG: tRNA preQ1(34) S-adenosylmethionine ribosyltransferase-isomerase QueA [Candidatus Magasanikbacteria bacterium CG_4_9_14_0_2_um_filter_41_10]|uniref:S-adenosylmethionine:tRNA ribosyltransferase-isomerase n=1 Tax=Candidatus Magasanikbacteria bacterium CG_4_10_14_0_2_um_filter_41_31 TaxID=1974639 RepID=A0A2M7V576_9BACT|nr:MAG: tRNA preQ1(34) S-adenosylmethionine ribosyltransferase-isomerase QueA [Candidatus Magasanikbacteria bacterium CG1_02_41_34]PIZ93726.1 MAG: tRNA preQ1(34) S-adenosylmethionine ribosyltransferase-isomerase QueA [Candidatus Magasanikbacteria bacterium CG_4_10_14_0_2_um_filter_41_31]PJC53714.1 MAG: tRNA preQ1(34) S-adenosylmethionine ribosyltransferase-isomerase QueA [Candidatus Magasanikbacteria bacterium CG_4_9_14_0_2_um_filter_41_10]